MSTLDEAKDSINNTRLYMSFVITAILAIGAGVSGLYTADKINILFWVGSVLVLSLFVIFVLLAKMLHNKTKALKDL